MELRFPRPRRRRVIAPAREGLRFQGRLSLTVVDGEGNAVDRREGSNVVCTGGYSVLAQAMVWSGIQDQAANLGVTSPTYLTPLYGAVGSGTGTPEKSDTALFNELSRNTVGAGGSSPASGSVPGLTTWQFFFPNPSAPWMVTEAGVFANATDEEGSGTLVDHWLFSPVLPVPVTNALVLQVDFQWGP